MRTRASKQLIDEVNERSDEGGREEMHVPACMCLYVCALSDALSMHLCAAYRHVCSVCIKRHAHSQHTSTTDVQRPAVGPSPCEPCESCA